MSFAPFSDGDKPTKAQLEALMQNILGLYGEQASQTDIVLEKPLRLATGTMGFQAPTGHFIAGSPGYIVRLVGNNIDDSSLAPPHGIKIKVRMIGANDDDEDKESLADVTFQLKSGTPGYGVMSIHLYSDGVIQAAPVFRTDVSNRIALNDSTGVVNVQFGVKGKTRADSYKVGGAATGAVWTDEGDGLLSFDGDAEVSGDVNLTGVPVGEEEEYIFPLEVLSTETCTGISASNLAGYDWPSDELSGTESVGISHSTAAAETVATATVDKNGIYVIRGTVHVDIGAAQTGFRFFPRIIRGSSTIGSVNGRRGVAGMMTMPVIAVTTISNYASNPDIILAIDQEFGTPGPVTVYGTIEAEWVAPA